MSVEHLAVCLHHSRATGVDKLVLLGIANHAGDGGAWPAVATLARYANSTERTVQRSLAKLIELGEIERQVQAGGLAGWNDYTRPNRYVVLVECPSWCDRTPMHRPREGWVWSPELRQVVAVEQLPLSTADTPEMQNHATRRVDRVTGLSPGDTAVTGGVTQLSPKPSSNHPDHVAESVPQPQHARDQLSAEVVHSDDVRAASLRDARRALRGAR